MTDDTALTVVEGRVERLGSVKPLNTIALATEMANALADIVERKRLYAVIGQNKDGSPKKFPTVEAWMIIARMDNVVAREMVDGVHQLDDGSFEAQVELIRLSDGMKVGHGSALCGGPDDKDKWGKSDWSTLPAHQRRAMAVTRATSRAFRQEYSWIMSLAGYEPTPAEEMRGDEVIDKPVTPEQTHADGIIGTVAKGKAPSDMEVRVTPDGFAYGFKLAQGRKNYQVLATNAIAEEIADKGLTEETIVTVWGRIEMVPWESGGKPRPPFARIHLERMTTAAWAVPSPKRVEMITPDSIDREEFGLDPIPVAEGQESLFDPAESAKIDAEEASRG